MTDEMLDAFVTRPRSPEVTPRLAVAGQQTPREVRRQDGAGLHWVVYRLLRQAKPQLNYQFEEHGAPRPNPGA